jgi:ribosomal protein S7
MVNRVALPIGIKKQIIFAIKWIIKLVKDKYNKISIESISKLLLDTLYNKGMALEKKRVSFFLSKKNRYLLKYFR